MKMYEYKVEHINCDTDKNINDDLREKIILEKLNSFGREGWELCIADNNRLYLKKEI